ncbi:MAG: type II CRISPR RNA-guided endonuclease Cas9, partial [Streptococcaceae bacterium]|nr:type II CRISPR RNA-guided endonuclease Cas9 [Streptococcaceae bacterium]
DDDILRQYNELGKDDKEANQKLSNERLFLYFIQNGKCLYSGKPLDISLLSTYDIDHIVPQSYIKDDSFSNKALVLAEENRQKEDRYPFVDELNISQNVKNWWKSLYNQSKGAKTPLFTKKKYEALTRTAPFSEFEKEGFINRQLVETRQIMKHVKNLLEEEFDTKVEEIDGIKYEIPKINVLSMKSQFTDGIRKSNHFYKSRNLNDYHHAHDAYIIANVGQFLKDNINYGDERTNIITASKREQRNYSKLIDEKDKASEDNANAKELRNKNSKLINWFNKSAANKETGEKLVDYMRTVLGYTNCNIVRLYSEEKGEFFNESVYRKAPDLIPVKRDLNGQKYGGTKGIRPAYCVLVKYSTLEKKKEISKIGVFSVMRIEKKTAEEDLLRFISQKNPDWKDIEIIEKKLLNNQIVITDTGIRRMFRSWNKTDGIVFNKGQQIVLESQDYQTLIKFKKEEFDKLEGEEKLHLYDSLTKLFKSQEILSDNSLNAFKELSEKFLTLPLKNIVEKTTIKEVGQSEVIKAMVSYISAGKVPSKDGNLDKLEKLILEKNEKGKPKNNFNNKIIKIGTKSLENYTVLHQSITGLYETRRKL